LDGQLKAALKMPGLAKRGGAVLALPLLLMLALRRPAAAAQINDSLQEEIPHLDATATLLQARPEALDDVPQALGFPATGGQFMLYGGGASFSKGALRVGVQGMAGGLAARQGGLNTEWRLRFGNLLLEQRYPYGQFMITGGSILTYGQVEGLLENNSAITRYDGATYGGGVVVGGRWPRQTRLGFLARAGYEWLPVSGTWRGALAAANPKASFDLGGPLAQLQVELSF
jgi:hypothetical protein